MPRRRRSPTPTLTLREVKQRAQTAGLTVPDDAWETILDIMTNALAPVWAFDSRAEADREPVVVFRP